MTDRDAKVVGKDHDLGEASTGQLIAQVSEQSAQLIREELRLAQLELQEKGKRAGLGIGMFGAAGVVALYGLGVLIATAVLALTLVLDAWLAALVVAVVLFVIAGVVALLGKRNVTEATPVSPQESIDGLKKDVATIKGGSR